MVAASRAEGMNSYGQQEYSIKADERTTAQPRFFFAVNKVGRLTMRGNEPIQLLTDREINLTLEEVCVPCPPPPLRVIY